EAIVRSSNRQPREGGFPPERRGRELATGSSASRAAGPRGTGEACVVRARATERCRSSDRPRVRRFEGQKDELEGVGIAELARPGPYQLRPRSESKTSPTRQRALHQSVYRRKSIFAANARQPTESL